jgi:hypothetical protein
MFTIGRFIKRSSWFGQSAAVKRRTADTPLPASGHPGAAVQGAPASTTRFGYNPGSFRRGEDAAEDEGTCCTNR